MIAAMTGYVLRGGKPGYDRLLLLARDRWADTRALLERAGIGAGMRCLDLGCGGGEVTMAIAAMVAPRGTVVGVDTDEVKLALARNEAAARRLGNVEFTALDVRDWDEPGGYDAVHARFLLHHLSQPDALHAHLRATGLPALVPPVANPALPDQLPARMARGPGSAGTQITPICTIGASSSQIGEVAQKGG
jgi:trans-aconitate methyltransferase